jgi:GTP-binding protein
LLINGWKKLIHENNEFDSSKKYSNIPTVALVGRPNVGKSTLFNRLLRKRRAITDPNPGVTRDPVRKDCFIAGRPISLVDTGGYKLERSSGRNAREKNTNTIDDLVLEKTLGTLKNAELIVLILEAGEITSEDEEFIKLLRPYRKRLIVAINKCEGGRMAADSWNLLSYGFEKVFMISAEHGDNVEELAKEIINRLDFSGVRESAEENRPIRIALLGKPNTGKSTLSNRLTSSNASIVSDIPGTTRDVVEGNFTWKTRDFVILDTAGIRRKTKVTENIEYYSVSRAIKTINEADIIILVIDTQEGLTDQDKKISALAHDKGRGIIFALNKWDTMPKIKNTFEATADRIRFLFGKMEFAPIIPVSAMHGTGVDKLLSSVITMYDQLNHQVETSRLNQALQRWLEEYPPPTGPHSRFNIKYAVQKSANPVKFIFFTSRPHAVGEAYISYLRNRIRKDLGFSFVPIEIKMRDSSAKQKKNRVK